MPSAQHQSAEKRPSNPMSIESMLNWDNQNVSAQATQCHHRTYSESERGRSRSAPKFCPPTNRRMSVSANACPSTPSTSRSSIASFDTACSPNRSSTARSSPENSVQTAEQPLGRRAPRYKYTTEQMFFVWYHRTDLGEHWDTVLQKFTAQFQQVRSKSGLECKFYRLLTVWGVEKVREQSRHAAAEEGQDRNRVGEYGVIQRTGVRFPWMREIDIHTEPLPQFRNWQHPHMSAACCQQHPYCRCWELPKAAHTSVLRG